MKLCCPLGSVCLFSHEIEREFVCLFSLLEYELIKCISQNSIVHL